METLLEIQKLGKDFQRLSYKLIRKHQIIRNIDRNFGKMSLTLIEKFM